MHFSLSRFTTQKALSNYISSYVSPSFILWIRESLHVKKTHITPVCSMSRWAQVYSHLNIIKTPSKWYYPVRFRNCPYFQRLGKWMHVCFKPRMHVRTLLWVHTMGFPFSSVWIQMFGESKTLFATLPLAILRMTLKKSVSVQTFFP